MKFLEKFFSRRPTRTQRENVLQKFEKEISTWDHEQARIAVACIASIINGDDSAIKQLFGKTATIEFAMGHLTVAQLRILNSTLQEIENETNQITP